MTERLHFLSFSFIQGYSESIQLQDVIMHPMYSPCTGCAPGAVKGQSWHRVSEMAEPALTTSAPTPSHRLLPSGRQSINAKFLLCARPVVGAGDSAKQDRLPALRKPLF